ncbi:TerB family tellurite resistance protein [Rhodovulum sp. YNF3179]
MQKEEREDWFEDVETVVDDPLRFKAKLGIGEDAYTSLRIKNSVLEAWDVAGVALSGASVASSSAVASSLFGAKTIWTAIGIGTATTPIGWVVAAGVLSGGAWLGITRYLKNTSSNRVTVVPDFINTPMDVLALGLFDLLAPLALKVADIDGEIHERERAHISDYFVRQWGYSEKFVTQGLSFAEDRLDQHSIRDLTSTLADFKKKNPDCNYGAMSKEITNFLTEITEADGAIDEREEMAIDRIDQILSTEGKFSLKRKIRRGASALSDRLGSLKKFKKVSRG